MQMSYYYTSFHMAKIKITRNNKSWQGFEATEINSLNYLIPKIKRKLYRNSSQLQSVLEDDTTLFTFSSGKERTSEEFTTKPNYYTCLKPTNRVFKPKKSEDRLYSF